MDKLEVNEKYQEIVDTIWEIYGSSKDNVHPLDKTQYNYGYEQACIDILKRLGEV